METKEYVIGKAKTVSVFETGPKDDAPLPVMIACHGLLNDKFRILSLASRKFMADHGLRVISFDFRGLKGKSAPPAADERAGGIRKIAVSDLLSVFFDAKEKRRFDFSNFSIYGRCLGAKIAAEAASTTLSAFSPMLFLSSPLLRVDDRVAKIVAHRAQKEISKTIRRSEIKRMIDSFVADDFFADLSKCRMPVPILVGDQDPMSNIDLWAAARETFKEDLDLHVVEGAGHTLPQDQIEAFYVPRILEYASAFGHRSTFDLARCVSEFSDNVQNNVLALGASSKGHWNL